MNDRVTARCCCGAEVYASSEIKAEVHRKHALAKAIRLATEHAEKGVGGPGHVVEIFGADVSSRVVVIACRCAVCGKEMPGNATGICSDCVRKRFLADAGSREEPVDVDRKKEER